MKGKFFILTALCFLHMIICSAQHADDILGIWLTSKQDSKIKILKSEDGTFIGKIIWAKSPYESFAGIEIIKGMTYNAQEKTYVCPWVYSPRLKVVARAVVSLKENTLNLKAKKGIITVHTEFTRTK
ncbi:MAG: hypothetical protein RR555_02010 [Bacteroidales bacterium]